MNTPAYFCVDQIVTEDLGTSSLTSILKDLHLQLFPNPVTDFVQIKSNLLPSARFFIYDQNGNRMFSSSLVNGFSELNVQDYLPGLYYLKLDNANNHSCIRFIKH